MMGSRHSIPDEPGSIWPELRLVSTRLPLSEYLRDAWRLREFAVSVPLGELRAQNQDTFLGQFWHLLNPLFLGGVYYLIFGVFLDVSGRGNVDNYIAFLLVGILTFEYTRRAVQSGARMIVKNRQLVQTINFPRVILPASSLVSETVTFLYSIPVMWVLLLASGVRPTWTWLLVAPLLVVQIGFNLGLAMVTARLTFHFRDVQQVLPFLLRIWLYVSGVIFPISPQLIESDALRSVLQINPMYVIIEIARGILIEGQIDGWYWAQGVAWSTLLLVAGFLFFRQAESEYGSV